MDYLIFWIISIALAEFSDQATYALQTYYAYKSGYKITPDGVNWLQDCFYLNLIIKCIPIVNIIYAFKRIYEEMIGLNAGYIEALYLNDLLIKLSKDEQREYNSNPTVMNALKMNNRFTDKMYKASKFYQVDKTGNHGELYYKVDKHNNITIAHKDGTYEQLSDEEIKEFIFERFSTEKRYFSCNLLEYFYIDHIYDIESHMNMFDFKLNVSNDSDYSCVCEAVENMDDYSSKVINMYRDFILSFQNEKKDDKIIDTLNNIYEDKKISTETIDITSLIMEAQEKITRKRK